MQQVVHVRHAPAALGTHNADVAVSAPDAPQQLVAVSGDGVAQPVATIIVTGAIVPFTAPASGFASQPQSYSVGGSTLTAPITVLAPAGFEVSLSAGSGFAAAVATVAPIGGVIPATPIYVRYLPPSGSAHAGNLDHSSAGAPTQFLPVSGAVVPPVIMLSGTLVAFVTTAVNVPSAVQSYTVSGSNLASAVDISAPSGFEVSLMASGGFAPNLLSPAPVSGVLASTMVFVRYNPSTGMTHSGDISHTSMHAGVPLLAASGTVVPPPPPPAITVTGTLNTFTTVMDAPSAEQSYTVSGANLVFAIGVSAPTGFEVSLTPGSGFAMAVNTPAPAAGTVPLTTIYVRFKYPLAKPGTYGGNITHSSTGAPAQNLAVTATVTAPPRSVPDEGWPGCTAGAGGLMAPALLALAVLRRRRLRPVARQVA
jgi:hypothetical protein